MQSARRIGAVFAWLVSVALAGAPVPAQDHAHHDPQRFDLLFKALDLKPGAVVADVGAGDGVYTVRLARIVGETGRVYAVDISTSALERLRARLAREGVTNVEVIHGDVDNPKLPVGLLDGVLVVNAYHEMREYLPMLTHIRAALKSTGRLVMADNTSARRGESRELQTSRHEIAADLVLQDIRTAGFRVVGLEDPFLEGHGHGHSEWLLTVMPAAQPLATASPTPVIPAGEPVAVDLRSADLRMSIDDFQRLYTDGRVVVLDVRDPMAFGRSRIPRARSAPMSVLRDLVPELQSTPDPIVTYCDCPAEEASARAAAYLRSRGVANVRALIGGWEKWTADGHPVER
jgi:rhodanese-related sulfurtransferase/precorrin-6B methylase 2